MNNHLLLFKVGKDKYQSRTGLQMQREYGKTPNGNKFGGRWVLRNNSGNILDFDQYSNNLLERNGLQMSNGQI